MTERFKCKTCMENADSDKDKSHHTELHRGGKAPVKKSAAIQNSQQPQQAGVQPTPLPTPVSQPAIVLLLLSQQCNSLLQTQVITLQKTSSKHQWHCLNSV